MVLVMSGTSVPWTEQWSKNKKRLVMCLPALCCYVTVSVASMSHSTCFRFNHTHHVTKELISVCVVHPAFISHLSVSSSRCHPPFLLHSFLLPHPSTASSVQHAPDASLHFFFRDLLFSLIFLLEHANLTSFSRGRGSLSSTPADASNHISTLLLKETYSVVWEWNQGPTMTRFWHRLAWPEADRLVKFSN